MECKLWVMRNWCGTRSVIPSPRRLRQEGCHEEERHMERRRGQRVSLLDVNSGPDSSPLHLNTLLVSLQHCSQGGGKPGHRALLNASNIRVLFRGKPQVLPIAQNVPFLTLPSSFTTLLPLMTPRFRKLFLAFASSAFCSLCLECSSSGHAHDCTILSPLRLLT